MPTKHNGNIFRLIDANFNRAKEALRVGEDLSRFLLDDKNLTSRFKRCRHDLTSILLKFPVTYRRMVRVRDVRRDVGKGSRIQDGKTPPDWEDLMIANLKRCQESTRVLEEVSKAVAPKQSAGFQNIRFRVYELEKSCLRKV